jgi:hypothetical protein
MVFECLRCAEGARRTIRDGCPNLSLRDIADPTSQGSAPAGIGWLRTGFRRNKARMFMKIKDRAGADMVFECLRCAEGARRTIRDDCPNLPLRDIADPTSQGSAPAGIDCLRTGFRRNKARMFMKTKDRAGADMVFECLRCAEGARRTIRDGCPNLSLRDIADPTSQGSAPAGIDWLRRGFRRNKARIFMKTKERAGADMVFECLRCAEGARRTVRDGCPNLSFRDIADPTSQGSVQPELAG